MHNSSRLVLALAACAVPLQAAQAEETCDALTEVLASVHLDSKLSKMNAGEIRGERAAYLSTAGIPGAHQCKVSWEYTNLFQCEWNYTEDEEDEAVAAHRALLELLTECPAFGPGEEKPGVSNMLEYFDNRDFAVGAYRRANLEYFYAPRGLDTMKRPDLPRSRTAISYVLRFTIASDRS